MRLPPDLSGRLIIFHRWLPNVAAPEAGRALHTPFTTLL
jgi:hypothetical protein